MYKMGETFLMKAINCRLKKLDEEYEKYIKYIGMVRLLKVIFSKYASGSRKTWEESLFEMLDTLNERERKTLEMRFGLLDGKPQTLDQVGRHFGVTRERIRQILDRAIRKLKHPSRKYVLMGASWQIAVQEAKQMGEKLLLRDVEKRKKNTKPISYVEIQSIGLPVRLCNALLKADYKDVHDLMKEDDKTLLKIRNVGPRSVRIIRETVRELIND